MKYRYRNANNGEVVEFDEKNERLDKLDNWNRIGEGDENIELGEESISPKDLAGEIAELDNADLLVLRDAVSEELTSRGLPLAEQHEPAGGTRDEDAVKGGDEDGDSSNDTDATGAAEKLAEDEGIDLSEVTGTGKDGQITIGDVRDAVKARDED